MQLKKYGKIVQLHWHNLQNCYRHLKLDKFIIMPNHLHGIIVLIDDNLITLEMARLTTNLEAGLANIPATIPITYKQNPPLPRQQPTTNVGAGLADISATIQTIGQQKPPQQETQATYKKKPLLQETPITGQRNPLIPQPAPAKRQGLPEIIRRFKTFSARRINNMRRASGIPVWQRNYYEHIIRNETSFQHICQYVINNPLSWELDQLHPQNPSKW